jgi:hypothetical protein
MAEVRIKEASPLTVEVYRTSKQAGDLLHTITLDVDSTQKRVTCGFKDKEWVWDQKPAHLLQD